MYSEPHVSNLFPAIAQSFAVILLGYIFGRFNFVAPSEAGSISKLVGRLFLPALLFFNLAILDLSTICWRFMAGLLVSKSAVFILTTLLTVVVTRPVSVGKAGLFGIFATQSNDFALGLPIVQALYGDHNTVTFGHFQYVSYIYLLAPISLAIINPVGFFMMEYQKQKSLGGSQRLSWVQKSLFLLGRTFRGVLLNPIVLMTILGIVWNVIAFYGVNRGNSPASHNVPSWFGGFLTTLGNAYAACALFLIGLFMVGKLQKLTGVLIVTSTVLIFAKMILLPIVDYLVVSRILPKGAQNTTSEDISTFAFLYGTFPTAPTVFVYAMQYNVATAIIASSIVLCTLMSAPIMYISARMVLVRYISEDHYTSVIETTRRDTSAVAMAGLVWVFILFIFARRYRSYIHVFVMHLMVAMFIECVSGELLNVFRERGDLYWLYFWFTIFFTSVMATRLWMAALALGLVLLLMKGKRVAERAWLPLMMSVWSSSLVVSIVLVSVSAAHHHQNGQTLVDVSFLFGRAQLVVTLVILIISFCLGLCSTIAVLLSARRNQKDSSSHHGPHTEADISLDRSPTSPLERQQAVGYGSSNIGNRSSPRINEDTSSISSVNSQPSSTPPITFDADITTYDGGNQPSEQVLGTQHKANEETPLLKHPNLRSFGVLPHSGVSAKDAAGQQLMSFVVLLLFLLFSCLVGLLIVVWKLTKHEISGIFIAVNILDTVTNFGQGFFVFVVFGFEKHWFWVAIYKKLRQIWFSVEIVVIPAPDETPVAVRSLCAQFTTNHLIKCKSEIVSDKRWYLREWKGVFVGTDLVTWLVSNEIADSREEAIAYGQDLMKGRVLEHVTQEHYFHDDNYFYRFLV